MQALCSFCVILFIFLSFDFALKHDPGIICSRLPTRDQLEDVRQDKDHCFCHARSCKLYSQRLGNVIFPGILLTAFIKLTRRVDSLWWLVQTCLVVIVRDRHRSQEVIRKWHSDLECRTEDMFSCNFNHTSQMYCWVFHGLYRNVSSVCVQILISWTYHMLWLNVGEWKEWHQYETLPIIELWCSA